MLSASEIFNINIKTNLPYILIPQTGDKLLIDTGSTKTILSPSFVSKHFPESIQNYNFEIKTSHGVTKHNEIAKVPINTLFKEPGEHTCYLFDFNPEYVGLIGSDLLANINAQIDFKWMHIQTEKTVIPFLYNPSKFKQETQKRNECNFSKVKPNEIPIKTIVVPPRSEIKIKLPTVSNNGTKICNKIKFNQNCFTPSAIVSAHNNYFTTTVVNVSQSPQEFNIYKPLVLQDFENSSEIEINNLEPDDGRIKQILVDNLNNIRTDHLNIEESQKLNELCYQYKDIFYSPDLPLTFTNITKHHIRTKTDVPIYTKTYRYPHVHRNEVKSQINKMLSDGIIEPSESPYNFPIWVVPKKDDASGRRKWRIVIDYRKLNEQTIEDKYPLPLIESVLDNLGRAEYFTTLDLASGFHQIEIEEKDREKTAFSTEEGHFHFKRMAFGLKNAPASFQRLINQSLLGLTPQQCMVYLDDIIIYSKSLQEHMIRLKNVFDRCRNANLKIQLDKSEFLKKSVAYLGHIITNEGIKPNPDKIQVIQNFPLPKTRTEIKSFLGMLGYYRKFIKDFSKITKFLTVCLKKDHTIKHTPEFIQNFEMCKNLLINEPILAYPDFSKPFELTTDASKFAVGAVLSQNQKPISFASRTLNNAEQNYTTIERELLAIVWATKNFRPYLFGTKFQLFTDHRPLIWLRNIKEPNSKLTRWSIKLEEFNFDIKYLPGKANFVADALSRVTINPTSIDGLETPEPTDNMSTTPQRSETPDFLDFTIPEFTPPSFVLKKEKIKILSDIQLQPPRSKTNIASNTITDEIISKKNNDDDDNNTVHSQQSSTPVIDISEKPLQHHPNQIEFISAILPKTIRNTEYDGIKHLAVFVNNQNKIEMFTKLLLEYCTPKTNYYCYFQNNEIFENFSNFLTDIVNENTPKFHRCLHQVTYVLNLEERQDHIRNYHLSKTNHRGVQETSDHLQRQFYWKGLNKDIQNFIQNCNTCKTEKYNRQPNKLPLQLTHTNNRPFQTIHIDIFQINNTKFLTIIDSFSKFAQAYEIRSANINEIIDNLFLYMSSYAVPNEIIADNEFDKNLLKDFLKLHNIKLHLITPNHHESNSPVERLHSTLIEHFRLLKNTPENKRMPYCILAYNNSIHSNLKLTPYEILFGHTDGLNPFELCNDRFYNVYTNDHKDKMHILYDDLRDKQIVTKQLRNQKINDQRKPTNFRIGQTVYIKSNERNKKLPKFIGPFKVLQILDRDRYSLQNVKKKNILERHANEIMAVTESQSLSSSGVSPMHQPTVT